MPENPFISEFLLILVAATVVAVFFERFRIPAILGFLLTGVLIGPNGFGFVADSERIHLMAEIGVVLLMLTIGLEFSADRLKGVKKIALWGGGMQILISIMISILFAWMIGWTLYQGFFIGTVIALSSTAIVLKYLFDRGELDTQYGRICLGILLFQDLAVPVLLIFISGVSQVSGSLLQALLISLFKASLLVGGVIVIARYVLPPVLRYLAVSKNREIFFLASVVICLGTAWIGEKLGFSLAIGAFFAGFMFANTEYGSQFVGEISPFRHVFVSIFFVSLGLLFSPAFAFANAMTLGWMVGLVLFVNFGIVTVLVMGLGYPPRIAMASGILLSQIGEFSFILIEAARSSGGIQTYLYQILLSTAFITMLTSPILFSLVPPLLSLLEKIPFFGMPPLAWKPENNAAKIKDHLILCGFGTVGFDLALTLREENLSFTILEMNPSLVQKAKKAGFSVLYGDAANIEVLRRAGIERAKAVVISFADPIGIDQIAKIVQRLNPNVFLVLRTRFEAGISRLYELGADVVVLEEWEASVQLNRVILDHLKVPAEKIQQHLVQIRNRHELLSEEWILKKAQKKF